MRPPFADTALGIALGACIGRRALRTSDKPCRLLLTESHQWSPRPRRSGRNGRRVEVPPGRVGQRSIEMVEQADGPRALTMRRDLVIRQSRVEKGKLPKGVHEPRPDEEGLSIVETVAPVGRVASEGDHERPVAPR